MVKLKKNDDDDEEDNKKKSKLEKKSVEKNKEKDKVHVAGENDWMSFTKTVLRRFIYVILIGFIGANFIYLTGQSDEMLNNIFPTDRTEYFPDGDFRGSRDKASAAAKEDDAGGDDDDGGDDDKQKGGGRRHRKQSRSRKVVGGGADKIKAISDPYEYENCKMRKKGPRYYTPLYMSFPYNLIGPEKSKWDIIQRLKNFLAITTADTYINNRDTLKSFLTFFAPADHGNIFSNQSFQMLFAAPLNLFFSFIVFLMGGIMSLFFALQADALFFIVGMIMMFTWVICGLIGLIQLLQYWKLFLFEPILHDWITMKKIVGCNIKILVILFGWLVCGAGFDWLDPTISLVMAIAFCVLVAKTLFTSYRDGQF